MKIRINIDLQVNRLVRYFILADLALFSGWGLIEPVFSVFIIEKIAGATLTSVGISAAIYWLVKSWVQLPAAQYLDKTEGEKDDFYALLISLVLAGITALSFILVTQLWQLYLVQLLHAVAFGLYSASWPAMFSRHLDKDKVSLDWSLDSSLLGLAAGVTGLIGGVVAEMFGYTILFFFAGLFSFVSALILFGAPDMIFPPKVKTSQPQPLIKDHTPIK